MIGPLRIGRRVPWALKLSVMFIGALALLAVLAPVIAPYAPDLQNVTNAYMGPSGAHWFGTDALGRDVFSRLVYGSQVSLSIALVTALGSVVVGVLYGTVSGWLGGTADRFLMRIVDILYTLPSLVVMILVMLIFGRGMSGIFVALTATGWLGTARLVRTQVLSWRERPFVEAARALGLPSTRIVTRHILPNVMGPVIVELSYQIPTNVLAEAFLSFLGVGLRPPTPSWGILAEEGWRALQVYPHLVIFPGAAIFLTMLAFNLVGDHLRDRLDPMLRGR